jgi:hypothetical protein
MDTSLVGLHSNWRSNLEAARHAVKISSEVNWFHAGRAVGGLHEEPLRVRWLTKMLDRCQYAVMAPQHATRHGQGLPLATGAYT